MNVMPVVFTARANRGFSVDIEICRSAKAGQFPYLIAGARVRRARIVGGKHGDRRNAKLERRPRYAQCDFSAVGNQYFSK
jgi:hypothetical protein